VALLAEHPLSDFDCLANPEIATISEIEECRDDGCCANVARHEVADDCGTVIARNISRNGVRHVVRASVAAIDQKPHEYGSGRKTH
jgi:hypothetical protein